MYNHAPVGYICPFCLAVQGVENDHVYTCQADVIYRDGAVTSFISAHHWPNNHGNAVIIPSTHYENLFELPDAVGAQIHTLARRIALAMKAAYGCEGISTRQHNEPAGSQDVWHYHLHIFPRYRNDNLYGERPAFTSPEERQAYAMRIKAVLPSIS